MMWTRVFLAGTCLGIFSVYLLYVGSGVFNAKSFLVVNDTSDEEATTAEYQVRIDELVSNQPAETRSCCPPWNSTSRPICGDHANCSLTCNDYQAGAAHFVRSLGDEAFFLETSAATALNYRQACSVESLALNNPNLTIHVLMSGSEVNRSSGTMAVLDTYPNVDIRLSDPAAAFLDSPLEHWYFCTDWFTGSYRVAHLADALRFLTLYKYGGYYFDLDVVTMRPLTAYRNFSAAESSGEVSIGAMHFDYKHPAVVDLVDEFRSSYK